MRNTLRLAPAEGVTPGGTATIRLPGPRCYHDMVIQCSSLPFSQINAVRVLANSRIVQEYTGEALDVINQFDGLQAGDDTFLKINFDQTGLKLRGHEEQTAFNVGSLDPNDGAILNSLEVQIVIDGAATGPKIVDQWATVSPVKAGGPGAIRSIYHVPGINAPSGRWDWDKLPARTRNAQFLSRIFIKASNLTNVEVKRDNITNWERTAALNTFIQNDSERFPQGGWFVVDFSENGYGENRLDVRTVKNLLLKMESNGAETVEMFAEYIGQLEI
ncbi:major capsid protein P2 [Streptomyces sp. B29(2018)]|uniref:major capsid protein P2 n=1 Tax=Streptomyces sp. B29(2018) TaxID=2485016 RepID=UPI0013E348BE|nr:major capsid protein P2 [Streptomyces sp. B29(2018)]